MKLNLTRTASNYQIPGLLICMIVLLSATTLLALDQQFGWPRTMDGDVALVNRNPAIVDIDGNGDWEVAILNSEGVLYVYQHDGANFPGFPVRAHLGGRARSWRDPSQPIAPAVKQLSGNGNQLIYVTDIGFLHAVKSNREEVDGFPVDLGEDVGSGIPAVIDFFNDDAPEIVLHTYPLDPDSSNYMAQLYIFESDGEPLEGYPKSYPRGSFASPVVGDITGDGTPEIITFSSQTMDEPAQVYAWGIVDSVLQDFPVGEFATVQTAPALTDIDGNAGLEIVFWAESFADASAGIYAYDGDGALLDGFPLQAEYGHPDGSPVVADLDQDGNIEIVYAGYNPDEGTYLYCWDSDSGMVDGFPIVVEDRRVVGSPLLADVSGNRRADIILTFTATDDQSGMIQAWKRDGEPVEGFPLEFENGEGAFAGTPTIGDLDRDGDNDIVAVTTDRRVFVWDTNGKPIRDEWPTIRGGMDRTGMRAYENPLSIDDDSKYMPVSGELTEAYPNPFNGTTIINIQLPENNPAAAQLIDIQGRTIGRYSTGPTKGNWSFMLNSAELNLTAGIYFIKWTSMNSNGAVRIVYLP